MKHQEVINTNSALTSYEQAACTDNKVTTKRENPQVTNSTVQENKIIGYINFPK